MDWIAFFFAVRHTEFDYLIETMLEYDVGDYIVAAETAPAGVHTATDGQHFHFCCQMTDEDYHKFSKRIKTKYGLSGQSRNGKVRGYGKVTKIDNLEHMKAYTVKDGNIRTNLEQTELEALREQSYKKEEKKALEKELLEWLYTINALSDRPLVRVDQSMQTEDGDVIIDYEVCAIVFNDLQKYIIEFYLGKDIRIPSPSLIKHYIKEYFAHLPMAYFIKSRILRRFMDIRNPFVGF